MRLHLAEWGSGPRTALLIHGLSNDSGTWAEVGVALAEAGFRVVAPDLRGHGRSPRGTYSIEELAGDLAENLPVGADLAVAHSLGARALLLAAERLQPLRVVYEDPAWKYRASDRLTRLPEFELRKQQSLEQIADGNPRWSAAALLSRLGGYAAWDQATAAALMGDEDLDYTPTGPPAQPSLILLAAESLLVDPRRVPRLRELGWEVEYVDGARHWVHLDQPEHFIGRVMGWASAAAL